MALDRSHPNPAPLWSRRLVEWAMLALVIFGGHGHEIPTEGEQGLYEKMAQGGRDGRGANLDAPADPNTPYPARPEWYFLSLFQLLKHFQGRAETSLLIF